MGGRLGLFGVEDPSRPDHRSVVGTEAFLEHCELLARVGKILVFDQAIHRLDLILDFLGA